MNEEIVRIAIQIISSSVTNLLFFLLFYILYKPKYQSKSLYIVLFILTSAIIVTVNRLLIIYNHAFFNSVFLFAYSCFLSIGLFNVKISKAFLHNAIYIILSAFVDVSSVLICTFITGKSVIIITEEIKYVSMFNGFYCLLMVVVWTIYVLLFWKNQVEEVKMRQIILVSLYVLFSIFVEYNFAISIKSISDAIIGLLILIGLFVSAVFIIYFTNQIARLYKEQYDINLIKIQNKIQLDHFNEISKKYEQSRMVIHDIKKHLQVLNSLNKSNDDRAITYSKIIEDKVDSLFGGFQCSNRILGIIMSQKILVAEKANIIVNTKVEDLVLEKIQDVDITAIFANLWDNAIEACVSSKSAERFINVIIGRVNDFLVISFENSFDGIIIQDGEVLLSSKERHEGIGLSIIKASVEKYHGTLTTKYNQNVFKVEILIPL